MAAQMGKQLGLVRTGVRTQRAPVKPLTPTWALGVSVVAEPSKFVQHQWLVASVGRRLTENEITIIEYCKKQFITNEYKYKIPLN